MSLEIPTQNSQTSDNDLPKVEFDVRTGAPKQGVKASSNKVIEVSDVKTQKGLWLKNKLLSLYNDPKYKNATPEQQKSWRSLAYQKWVTPYYKQILKTDPPTEEYLFEKIGHGETFKQKYTRLNEELRLHTLKAASEATSGLIHLGSVTVGAAIDHFSDYKNDPDFHPEKGDRTLTQIIESSRKLFDEGTKEFSEELKQYHGGQEKIPFKNDIPGRIAELGTGAAFFEATGAAKAAKVLNVANPRTAALAYQMAKASWNGAIDFGLWSASQGEKPKDILESTETGAVFGIGAKLSQRKLLDPLWGIFKEVFKWGGKDATKEVLDDVFKGPKGETSTALTAQGKQASLFTRDILDKYSAEKFGKGYQKLNYIQRQHVINRMMSVVGDAIQQGKIEGMPPQIVQAQAQEQNDLVSKIFPEAKASQEKVDKFIAANGQPPQQTKLLASLPHHNTTVDSSWKNLQARASFLKAQLKTVKEGSPEFKDIQQALNEEYALMKIKKAKQQSSKGTVGGAAAGDPTVFRGEEYVITPNVDPYKHGFTEWQTDSFAQGVAQQAKIQALAKGQEKSFITNSINNSYLTGASLAKNTSIEKGFTKQLFHSQFGLVGGVNYEFMQAGSLGERSGIGRTEQLLYINYLGMRPNVVARVWNVPGGGQSLFLNVAQEANRRNIGIALIPFDESKSFYEKMGMREVGSYMIMDKDQVKNLLKNKGLLMMLLGAGISYGSNKVLADGDFSVKGSN